MLKYILKRLLESLGTIFIILTLVFLLMRMLPTDYYFTATELDKLTDQQKEDRLRAAGLLDPIHVQLFKFYYNLFTKFDFGNSRRIQVGVPVWELIGSKVGMSFKFGGISLALSLVVGVAIGILQARYKDGLVDHIGTAYTVFVNAVPSLVSYSLILIFGARVLGLPSLYSVRDPIKSSIMPIVCLSLGSIAGYMLWIRRYMVDELNKDYIKLAMVKGLSTRQIMVNHILKNAFVPMVQYLPGSILHAIVGSMLMEKFFSVPGMGPMMTQAIGFYDTNVVQALVVLYSSLGVVGVLLGDVMMTLIDPRIRLVGKGDTR